jgi:hypothetical protein
MSKATTTREAALHEVLREFQVAEKRYTKAVSDVVQAEIRRDEAKREKDECYLRLEKARVEFSNETTIPGLVPSQNGKMVQGKPVTLSMRRGWGGNNQERQSFPSGKTTARKEDQEVKGNDKLGKKPSFVPSSSAAVAQNEAWQKETNGSKKENMTRTNDNRQPQKRIIKKALTIEPLSRNPQPVLNLCKGRTREWCEKHLDCDSLGLVRHFYKATFGTRTNPDTKKMIVSTIVVSDEWNDFVQTTGEVQVLCIGKSLSADTRSAIIREGSLSLVPSLREKAAEALAEPQKESIALFFAPVKRYGHIYYVGHWKVKLGEMMNLPKVVKGEPTGRQYWILFEFVGLNPAIIQAMNSK